MGWTDERVALLKKMWKDGNSAADIAKALGKGVTRNAVIGKAHRMGLSGRPSPIKGGAEVKEAKSADKKKSVKEKPSKAKVETKVVAEKADKTKPTAHEAKSKKSRKENESENRKQNMKADVEEEVIVDNAHDDLPPADGGVALIDLTERMCRWPYGDPREEGFTFCGKPAYPGKPYCGDHVMMAYQTSARARAAAKLKESAMEDDLAVDINDVVDEDEIDEDEVGNVD